MKQILGLIFFFFVNTSQAKDILWIEMNVNHSYQSASQFCQSVKPGGELYFAAEHQSGQLTRVSLSNFPNVWPYEYIYKNVELTPEDIKQIELYKDSKGRYWLKKLPLPGYVLRWILFWATKKYSYCSLPEPLWTISPTQATYEFETEGIEEGILISYSRELAFQGKSVSGEAFSATLQLVQREFNQGGFP